MQSAAKKAHAAEVLFWSTMPSPLGELRIVASKAGLRMIDFAGRAFPPANVKAEWEQSDEITHPYVTELNEYFAGCRRAFSFPLDLRGTPFQLRCWNALLAIPYGETRSYAQQAMTVGCGKGFRAVGQANHHNPIPIVVPCHRVLASDGKLAGYGGGLEIKRKLLELEGAKFRD